MAGPEHLSTYLKKYQNENFLTQGCHRPSVVAYTYIPYTLSQKFHRGGILLVASSTKLQLEVMRKGRGIDHK
jgi:hypothetical protein